MPLIPFRGWAGGVNRKLPSDQVLDTEVTNAINVELDSRANLRTRPGSEDVSTSTTISNRVTSVFYFEKSDGTSSVFATEGNSVRQWNGTTTWTALAFDIGNACNGTPCVLPSGATWYWTVFNNKLIGVNGAASDPVGTGTMNTVKIDTTTSPTLKDLSTDAAQPDFRFIEVANSRVFGVQADSLNTLWASKLGDAEGADAWSSTGIAGTYTVNVGGDEGGRITAIKLYRNQLIVFKRRRIYAVFFGSPNTDTAQWEVRQLVNNVGCISQNSVQEILGDLVFLSDEGLMSLQRLLSSSGDLERSLLSENIPALRQVPRNREDYPSVVIPEKSQYLISIPTENGNVNDVTWVMDYAQLSVNGRVAFTSWTGGPTGASFGQVVDSDGNLRVFIGRESSGGSAAVYRLRNDTDCTSDGATCFEDAGVKYKTDVTFKALNFDEPLIRKQLHRWGIEFGALTDPLNVTVFLSIDGNDANARSWSLFFSGLVSGGSWDIDTWDNANWASEVSTNTDVWRKVSGVRRFQQMQLRVLVDVIQQGVSVKNMSVEVSRLTHRRASDV